MLRVVSNQDLDREEEDKRRDMELAERQATPLLQGLTHHMKTAFDAAKEAKRPIEERMLTSLRQRNGEYDPDKLADIQEFGGSDIFMMITETKCRAAESWIRDILLEEDAGPPWDISSTPLPELPPEVEGDINERIAEKVMQMIQDEGESPSQQAIKELRQVAVEEIRAERE